MDTMQPVPSSATTASKIPDNPHGLRRVVLFITLVIAFAGIGLTWQIWRSDSQMNARQRQERFDLRTDALFQAVRQRLEAYQLVLRASSGMVDQSDPATMDWWRFVQGLRQQPAFSSLESLSFLRVVSDLDVSVYLTERLSSGNLPPRVNVAYQGGLDHVILANIAPNVPVFEHALGMDVAQDLTRRALLNQARDSGNAVLADKVDLLGDVTVIQADTLLYLPIYRRGMATNSVEARRHALRGYLCAAFRLERLISDTVSSLRHDEALQGLAFTVQDITDPAVPALLYASGGGSERASRSHSIKRINLEIAGRTWMFEFFAMPTVLQIHGPADGPPSLPVVMAALSAILTLLIYIAGRLWLRGRQLGLANRYLLEHQQELHLLATSDPLTGLPNRRQFNELGAAELARARRHNRQLCLMMLDVDHFKAINDRYGHPIGDEALKLLTSVCRTLLRECDLLARFGGEEFAVILPETDLPAAMQVAERLRIGLAQLTVPTGKEAFSFTVSIGLARATLDDHSLHDLLSRADEALYAAKAAGRNKVIVSREALVSL